MSLVNILLTAAISAYSYIAPLGPIQNQNDINITSPPHTVGYLIWPAEKFRWNNPTSNWIIRGEIGVTPKRFTVVLNLYMRRQTGVIVYMDALQAPNAKVVQLIENSVQSWTFHREEDTPKKANEIWEMHVAFYVTRLGANSISVVPANS